MLFVQEQVLVAVVNLNDRDSDDIVCPLVRESLTAAENRRGTIRQTLRESAAFHALKYSEALLQHGDGGEKPTGIIKSPY